MRSVRAFFRQPVAATAFAVAAAIILASVFANVVAPHDPLAQDLRSANALPGAEHWLGADTLGRDICSRLLYGGRITLTGALIAVAVFVALGVPAGLLAGYRRGLFDLVASRVVEVMFAIPVMIIVMVVVSVFSSGVTASMLTIGILGSGSLFRVVRGQTMAAAQELYVKAARSEGLRARSILRRHILPNIWGPVIVQTTLFSAGAILTESGLAFLGFSVQPPAPSWGSMIGEASRYISAHPWQLIPPGVLIGVIVMCLGLIGDGVRDAVSRTDTVRRPGRRAGSRRRGQAGRPAAPAVPAAPAALSRPGAASPDAASRTPASTGAGADPQPDAILSVRGLTVAFGRADSQTVVVQDVSFDVGPGESVGVVGESGSGKTVVARSVIGLLGRGGRVISGQVFFDGQELTALPPAALAKIRGRDIALIPQEPTTTLDPAFTIGKQIAEVVRRHDRRPRAEVRARVIELLSLVGLAEPETLVGRYPHELSGGMAQRVGIALALAGRPRLLIADEPTTALDVTVQQQILDLLRDLQDRLGMAILVVTHDWGVLADLTERAGVMYAGQVVESAPIEDLYHRPLSPYTRALIAANPHNATKGEPLPSIPGQVLAPADWPIGCHFAPRCALATPECSAGPVELRPAEPGHSVRCLHSASAVV
ncbi:MAG: dipeptide/oligopeptide/nickel ABC transporter permease/ATP-binding protein [Bifidobacteriaceae bacterium]|jgi:peptide/nickel transport system permease protein|nr:dipeptide/oligopeptide/nickel ABC transporter permease/ATP-binding protein [Bifidobacteriaceae bacterium]